MPTPRRRRPPARATDTSAQNIVGPHVQQVRLARGITQDMLAGRCAAAGWVLSENGVAKIEGQLRKVSDRELVILATALRCRLADLLPDHPQIF